MSSDFNAELHARPSIYFTGPAFVEHIALMPVGISMEERRHFVANNQPDADENIRTQVEYHTEFVTVTRVTQLKEEAAEWPTSSLTIATAETVAGMRSSTLICRIGIVVNGPAPAELGPTLVKLKFGDT